ncbi:MAG: pYEATS domain-containing protein [Pseudomonadota bacterium]
MSDVSSNSSREMADIASALNTAKKSNRKFWLFSIAWAAIMVALSIGFGISITRFMDTQAQMKDLEKTTKLQLASLNAQLKESRALQARTSKDSAAALQRAEDALKLGERSDLWANNLRIELNEELDLLRKKLSELQSGNPASGDRLTAEELNSIRIEQTAQKIQRANSKRNWRRLTFQVSIEGNAAAKERVLRNIEEVTYHFDERWYSNPSRSRSNAANLFKLTVEVWGPTEVVADIRIRGRQQPIRRFLLMSLDDTAPNYAVCGKGGIEYACLPSD